MKRRIKLSTLLKRTVIAIIAILVVTVILVFAFDKYSPTDNTYTNKYDDAYWNQSTLTDFEYSQDILKRADKYNLNNSLQFSISSIYMAQNYKNFPIYQHR